MAEHVQYKCHCNQVGCQFCDGGLFACTICRGFEGSLPTDCPGARMTQMRSDEIYAGRLDFRAGRGWVAPDGTGNSMGDIDVRVRKIQEAKKKRSCNRHNDCDAADAAVRAKGGFIASHCHDDCCEDCFGS